LMRISSITTNNPILFAREFRRVVRSNIPIYLLLFHPHVFSLLLDSHDESSVRGQLVLTLRLLQGALVLLLLTPLVMLGLLVQVFM